MAEMDEIKDYIQKFMHEGSLYHLTTQDHWIKYLYERVEKIDKERWELFEDKVMWIEGSKQQHKEIEQLKEENVQLKLELLSTKPLYSRRMLEDKIERYEKALKDITSVPRDWSESYSQAWPTCIKIALKALEE